jgi:hypothetical protein
MKCCGRIAALAGADLGRRAATTERSKTRGEVKALMARDRLGARSFPPTPERISRLPKWHGNTSHVDTFVGAKEVQEIFFLRDQNRALIKLVAESKLENRRLLKRLGEEAFLSDGSRPPLRLTHSNPVIPRDPMINSPHVGRILSGTSCSCTCRRCRYHRNIPNPDSLRYGEADRDS